MSDQVIRSINSSEMGLVLSFLTQDVNQITLVGMVSYAIFFFSWSYTFSRQTIFRMNNYKDSVCVQGPKHCVQSLTDIVVL